VARIVMMAWICLSSFTLRKHKSPERRLRGKKIRQETLFVRKTSRKLAKLFPKGRAPRLPQSAIKGASDAEN
jgi:hypothetical protein